MFKYTLDNKRYHTLNYYLKNKFNDKVIKISLNGNFTCPNIDGTKGYGGCIYCSKSGSGEHGGNPNKDLTTQFNEVREVIEKKWPSNKYIAYFQARTNTYAPLNILKEKYEEVLRIDNVIGLFIATRCDAITKETLDYLEELNKRTFLVRDRNINVVVHIINGLPYETEEMMLDTVKHLNNLDIQGIKIHMLNICKDTPIETLYNKEHFHILTKEEYIDIVIKQLELLREEIVIHRITSDPDKDSLIEPTWLLKKFCLLNDIDKEMKKRDTYQGKYTK